MAVPERAVDTGVDVAVVGQTLRIAKLCNLYSRNAVTIL